MPYLYPMPGRVSRARPERVLFICYFDANGISTPIENIAQLQRASRFSLEVLNLYGADLPFRLPGDFPIDSFDAVVIHNTAAYTIDNVARLDERLHTPFNKFPGVKILFKQDEQYRADRVARFIAEKKIDLVFTCLPESEVEAVYPISVSGSVRYRRMLTGYVTEDMRAFSFGRAGRTIDVGYRGSIQPIYFGRLAYEKRQIGDLFQERARGRNLRLDITSDAKARLSGPDWIKFLGSCRATLGTESGASIFDLDGTLEPLYESLVAEFGEHPESKEWCESILARLAHLEGRIDYAQVSPRHFEASATRTVQILYEGSYSGIFEAGRHYISLKKDFSNFETVLEQLGDANLLEQIAEAAYDEIICNREFWSETFAEQFDSELASLLEEKNVSRVTRFRSAAAKRNALLLCAHVPRKDPRIAWLADFSPPTVQINVLGVHDAAEAPRLSVTNRSSGALEVQVYRRLERAGAFEAMLAEDCGFGDIKSNPGLLATTMVASLARMDDVDVGRLLGGFNGRDRVPSIRWYWEYLLNTTNALVKAASSVGSLDLIVAADLDSLVAGAILKRRFKVPLVYDAHEYWPEADPSGTSWEIGFWRSLESLLLSETDARFTVSPPLARFMSETYGLPFVSVPNAEPSGISIEFPRQTDDPKVVFLFQGGFAKGRGLELLISHWKYTSERAELHLRGPKWEYSEELESLAAASGLLGTRIRFLDAVTESELVAAAAVASVGVIPYEPHGANNRSCCPNKLSQYAAARLPLFANDTDFVRSVVSEYGIGKVVDFKDRDAFVAAVNEFVENPLERVSQGARARAFYETSFHWEEVAKPLYESIDNLLSRSEKRSETALHGRSAEFVVSKETDDGRVRALTTGAVLPESVSQTSLDDAADVGSMITFDYDPGGLQTLNERNRVVVRPPWTRALRAVTKLVFPLISFGWRHMPTSFRKRFMPIAERSRRVLSGDRQ